jgi:hypothetical protein
MPPQQAERLPDVFDGPLGFRTHDDVRVNRADGYRGAARAGKVRSEVPWDEARHGGMMAAATTGHRSGQRGSDMPTMKFAAGICATALLMLPLFAAAADTAPDFSGQWARSSLGFESPAAGRGPMKNRNILPDGSSNFSRLEGDYSDPILTPRASAVLKRLGAISRQAEAFSQPSNQCLPYPPPYSSSNNQEIELLQEKDRVVILTMFDHQFRTVRLNATHPAHVTPSWYGDSIGHYEGDTLVVDTVGIKPGPFPMVDIYGTPFSSALHVIERFRLIDNKDAFAAIHKGDAENKHVGGLIGDGVDLDMSYKGKGLELQITVEDPNIFREPWHGTVTYVRPLGQWQEMVCAENTREYYASKDTAIPVADKPDF